MQILTLFYVQEKQKTKIKEKLDKYPKAKLLEFCDLLDIPNAKNTARKVGLYGLLSLVCLQSMVIQSTDLVIQIFFFLFLFLCLVGVLSKLTESLLLALFAPAYCGPTMFFILMTLKMQEDIVAKLIDFLVAPHATTDVLLAEKEVCSLPVFEAATCF